MIYISLLPGIISRPNFSALSLNNSPPPSVTSWLTVSLHFLNWYFVSTEGAGSILKVSLGPVRRHSTVSV